MARYPGNFVNSGIVTVPNRLRTRSNTPTTKLAYITPEEEGILQALQPGTPHRGPMGIPNYDSVDWDPSTGQYSVTTGAQASAQEVSPRRRTQQEKRDVAAAPEPSSLPSGQAYAFDPVTYQPTGQVVGTPAEAAEAVDTKDDDKKDKKDKKAKKPAEILKIFKEKGKRGLTEEQLVRIVHLLAANKQNENVLKPEEEEAFSGLFGENYAKDLEERIQEYREGYPDYFKGKMPGGVGFATGFWDSMTAGDYRGDKVAEEQGFGSPTLSGLKKGLSTSDEAWLKINRPDLYYGGKTDVTTMPGLGGSTMGEMEDLASLSISGPGAVTDPELIRRIVEAREVVSRQQDQTERNQGIFAGRTAPPGPPPGTTPPGTPPPGTTPPGTTPPGTTLPPPPFDYTQWPQFPQYPGYPPYGPAGGPVPNYVNQGLGQWPQFNYWNQIANAFPGMRNYG